MTRGSNGQLYRCGITRWHSDEEALLAYFRYLGQHYFPSDAYRAGQFVDVVAQALLPVLADASRNEHNEKRFAYYREGLRGWHDLAAEFVHAGHNANDLMGRIGRQLRTTLTPNKEYKLQQYYLNLIMGWLAQSVADQQPWLFNYDAQGRINRFNITRDAETLKGIAQKEFKGFHIYGLINELDYVVTQDATSGSMRWVKLTSLDALNAAGAQLQNCIQNGPGINDLKVDYHHELTSGRAQFVALCSPRGEMHGLLRITDGVLQEASGKQSALLAPNYMDEVISYLYQNRITPSPHVFLHGVFRTTKGLMSYLELVDQRRVEKLYVAGNLVLNNIRNDYHVHGRPFAITNLSVEGTLYLDNTQVRSIRNTRAQIIVLTRSPAIHELDTTVKADELWIDRLPDGFRLHMIGATNQTSIGMVAMRDASRSRTPRKHPRISGTEYALRNPDNNPFIREFGNALRTARPPFNGNDDGAPPSSTPR